MSSAVNGDQLDLQIFTSILKTTKLPVAPFSLVCFIQESNPDSFIGHLCALFYVRWFTRLFYARNYCQIWTI